MCGTAHPARSLPVLAALMILAITWAPPLAAKDISRVTLTVPMPARIDMGGIHTVLVTRFIVDQEAESVDVNSEMITLLRSQLRKRTNLRILDVDPPALPEQPLSQLLANTGFWRKLAETYGADLLIAGKVGFEVSDRSGFVERDEISPLTGQRIRRTRFVDREGILLDMNLFFIRGSTGRLQYEDHLTAENTLMGMGNDRLSSLFVLYEQFEDDILGIVVPSAKTVQRFLFME